MTTFSGFYKLLFFSSEDPSERPRSPIIPSEVASVTFKAEDLIQSSESSWTALSSVIEAPHYHGDIDEREKPSASPGIDLVTSASSKSIDDKSEDETRLKYLREKLLQCLSSLSGDSPRPGFLSSNLEQSSKISDNPGTAETVSDFSD